jgi:hypothetical protein
MTNNTGKVKKYKKKFQHLNKKGARLHRKDFIETPYLQGVQNNEGDLVIRPLNQEEVDWLNNFYKEYVHSTFTTDKESTFLFKKAKRMSRSKQNLKYLEENNEDSPEVKEAINNFNKKSRELGNMFYEFYQQRDINSDDYKRKHDIQNNSARGISIESFEDIQEMVDLEDFLDTQIEDLITESEE